MHWLDRYRVFRRLTLIWACALITYGTVQYFTGSHTHDPTNGYISLVGILSVVIGFYVKWRHDDDRTS